MATLERKLYDPLSDLRDLEAALQEREKSFWDDVIPAKSISMDPDSGHLLIRAGDTHDAFVQDHALDQIAVRLKIPGTYLRRCPPELQAANVNHWLRGMGHKRLLVRFDGSEVRAILTPSYAAVSNSQLVSRFREMAEMKGMRLQVRFEWTRTRFIAQIVEVQRDLAVPGDSYLGGIQLLNSETGDAALALSAMLYRLVCTNGMTVKDQLSLRRTHRREPGELLDELGDMVSEIWTRLPTVIDPLTYLAKQPMPDPTTAIEGLVKRHVLSDEQREGLHKAFLMEPGDSLLFLLHALTRAANDQGLNLEERTQLQVLAGAMLGELGSGEETAVILHQ